MKETIGAYIKQLRLKKGLSQAELAKRVGISQSIIGQYEVDKRNPKAETLNKLAKVLDCDINALIAYKSSTENDTLDIDFYNSQEYLDTNRQFFRISSALNFLSSLRFSFIEKLIFESEEFTRNCPENLSFTSNNHCNDLPPLEYCDWDLIEIIKRSSKIPKHIMEIRYEDSIQQMEYSDYLKWITNFIESTRAIALQQYHNISEAQIFLDDIDKAINQHAEEIAQGTWQAPSEEEDEQRLLQAIYGEKIPENKKKEE